MLSHAQSSRTITRTLSERRENRYGKLPPEAKIPGLDISELTTEQLELLLSLNLDNNSTTKAWKTRAAHKLATRFIKGDKAPINDAKAHTYAEMEINSLSIEELESKFFHIQMPDGKHIPIINAWHNKKPEKNDVTYPYNNKKALRKFIDQAKWNDQLKIEKQESAHAILLAWEKQLVAKRLAEHYQAQSKLERSIENVLAATFYQEIQQYLKDHEKPSTMPQWLMTIFSWFNSIRLATIRLNKTLTQFNAPFLVQPLLKWAASIAGLYFLVELLVDIGILIKAALFNWKGEFSPSLTRLKNTFWDDNRPSRMMNDLIWFGINFTCLILTILLAPVAPLVAAFWCGALTVAGCVFDVGAEVAIGLYAHHNQRNALDTIDAEIDKPDKKVDALTKIKQKTALDLMHEQLLEKHKALVINRAYTIAIMFALLVCAGFMFFPPAGLVLVAPMVAASAALVIGSLFGGLGKRLFWSAPAYFNQVKNFALETTASFKEWLNPSVKQKLLFTGSRTCPDDWKVHANTKLINDQLTSGIANINPPAHETMAPQEETKIREHCRNHSMHRSPSGLLFVHEPKPPTAHVDCAPSSKNLLSV